MLQRTRFMRWLTTTLLADDAGAAAAGLEVRIGGVRDCGKIRVRLRTLSSGSVVALSRR